MQPDESAIRRAIKFNTIDTVLALSLAFFVNAAILVLAAQTFYGQPDHTLADGQVQLIGVVRDRTEKRGDDFHLAVRVEPVP